MTELTRLPGARELLFIRVVISTAVLALIAANAHLVYVAVMSQPDCVQHIHGGDVVPGRGGFSAAQSSCGP